MKRYTSTEAAIELDLDISRVQQLCRNGRLGYSTPRHGTSWVITAAEIARFRSIGPKRSGRPKNRK